MSESMPVWTTQEKAVELFSGILLGFFLRRWREFDFLPFIVYVFHSEKAKTKLWNVWMQGPHGAQKNCSEYFSLPDLL